MNRSIAVARRNRRRKFADLNLIAARGRVEYCLETFAFVFELVETGLGQSVARIGAVVFFFVNAVVQKVNVTFECVAFGVEELLEMVGYFVDLHAVDFVFVDEEFNVF
jgi:hypothetical protein